MYRQNKRWQLNFGKLSLLSLSFLIIYYLFLYLKIFSSSSTTESIGIVSVVLFLIFSFIWLFKSLKQENIRTEDSDSNNKWGQLSGWTALLLSLIFIFYSFIPYAYRSILDNYPIMPLAFILSLFFGIVWLIVGSGNKAIIKWSLIRIIIYTAILFLPSMSDGQISGAENANIILYGILFSADLLISIIVFVVKKLISRQ